VSELALAVALEGLLRSGKGACAEPGGM